MRPVLCALAAAALLSACGPRGASLTPGALLTPAGSASVTAAQSPGCRFDSAPKPVNVAFCETFDHPAGIGNRSGQLDGTVWGVSRMLGPTNFGQGQYNAISPTVIDRCGTMLHVKPPMDVEICDGRLAESVNDGGTVTSLAMYPKQPFDVAGRTGTIVFDVSDDSKGTHRVWPELWYTDHPVPVPFVHFTSLQSTPQNGFGVRFAAYCAPNVAGCGDRFVCPELPMGEGVITVDSAIVVNDYRSDDSFADGHGKISVKQTDCVEASSGPGDMNHFELRVSQNEIDVYGTDAGKTRPLRKIAIISNMRLTLTRGLVWLEDAHYNADKAGFGPDQGTHTFTWDNVGFDGPLEPRDLAFDVLDRLEPIAGGLYNLGWPASKTAPAELTVRGVYNVANAQAAYVTFNYAPYDPVTMQVRLNGKHWVDEPWPFPKCYTQNGDTLCGQKTTALQVPLTDVRAGTNTIEFRSSEESAVYNVDLILKGAAGLP